IGGASARMLHYMDQPFFCGTACHSVMDPEWVTYRQSPHARVSCVDCHVGEGVGALIDSKINGTWQMISVTFDLLERPIPTPVHTLRPARETCEKCHWPELFHGNRIKQLFHYGLDEESTRNYTTLLMKIGSGREGFGTGVHWHISSANEVRYASMDDEHEKMIWVDVRQDDGGYKRYRNKSLNAVKPPHLTAGVDESSFRTMDCVDCHNRATHIYEAPEPAIDDRIRQGSIDRSLPFIKKRMLGALINGYPDRDVAAAMIDAHIRGYYEREYPVLAGSMSNEIDAAVKTTQDIYNRNIHTGMNITWNSYPSHLGHQNTEGCFRCHNLNMVDDDVVSISMDCTLCHSILAVEESHPYEYLFPVNEDSTNVNREMHRYLQNEFYEFTGD
ncbi:MAG: NapC/NirT family cytochrome c, partial [Candidatus Electryoneaceae bacterium]|nr:NapC/NirT family cytochrome c [Candidatus Electryoneaceae bacterium]